MSGRVDDARRVLAERVDDLAALLPDYFHAVRQPMTGDPARQVDGGDIEVAVEDAVLTAARAVFNVRNAIWLDTVDAIKKGYAA